MNTTVMNEFRSTTIKQLQTVWRWWITEIEGLLPGISVGTRRGIADTIFVELTNDVAILHAYERNEHSASHEMTMLATGATNLTAEAKVLLDGATRVIARLPADQVVRTELTLPRATLDNLRQVLSFEMDRHTPFNADQVYYDFDVKANVGQQIIVDLVVVRRNTMDALLERLASAGINATVVDVDDGELEGNVSPPVVFNMLPATRSRVSRPDESVAYRWWPWILAGLAVVALTLPLAERYIARAGLAAELESVREAAADVEQTRDELRRQLAPMVTFSDLRKRSPLVIAVLDELTLRLPDNTWLSRLELSGNEVSMQGESADAAALISILEESQMLSETRFASPITRNPTTSRDRFVIESKLATGAVQ
jgi:general secretion pathway protein L